MMQIETFIFRTYQRINHVRRYFLKLHRRTVLIEELSNEHTVSTIDKRSFIVDRVFDDFHIRRLAKESQEINIHGSQIEEEENDECGYGSDNSLIPTPSILSFVPKPSTAQAMSYCFENINHR